MDNDQLIESAGALALLLCYRRLQNVPTRKVKRKRKSFHHYRKEYHPSKTYWWKEYVIGDKFNDPLLKDKMEKRFRRLFAIPRPLFLHIVTRAKSESWFPEYTRVDDTGLPLDITGIYLIPLELKILCALMVLTKGLSFHTVSEFSQGDHEETHRTFFHLFIEIMVLRLFEDEVHLPKTENELNKVLKVYSQLGYPGCCFSMDCVHIKWKNCPFRYRNQFHSYKNGCPCISYNVSCNHSGFISTVSQGEYATMPDSLIVRFDLSVLPLLNDPLFKNKKYNLYADNDTTIECQGVYGLTDNGYLSHKLFAFPLKGALNENFYNWSKRTESVRKDIECVFGKLKVRFQILNHYIQTQDKVKIDRIFKTCCILHNMILKFDGYDSRLYDASNWIQERNSTNEDEYHLHTLYDVDSHYDNDDADDPHHETIRNESTNHTNTVTTSRGTNNDNISAFLGYNTRLKFTGIYETESTKAEHGAHIVKLVNHYKIASSKYEIYWPKSIR